MSVLRWLLVLPAAVAAWLAGDFLTALVLNIFAFFKIELILPFLQRPPWAYHLILLGSFFAAVLGGAFVAPKQHRHIAAVGVAVFLFALRLVMTGARFAGREFTEDKPAVYLMGTLFASVGLALGIWLMFLQREDGAETLSTSAPDT